jgi:hypothetical protein
MSDLQNLIAKMDNILEGIDHVEEAQQLDELDLNNGDKGAEALRIVQKLYKRVERLEQEINSLRNPKSSLTPRE